MSAELLIRNWKLVSWQVVTEDGAKNLFGPKPNGYFIVTRDGRAMTVTTAKGRTPGETDAERAALHRLAPCMQRLHTTVLALSLRDNLCVWRLGVLGDDAAEGTMQTLTASLYLIIIPEWQQFDPRTQKEVTATFPILIDMGVAQCAA